MVSNSDAPSLETLLMLKVEKPVIIIIVIMAAETSINHIFLQNLQSCRLGMIYMI
jgi:hypothetical protein